MELSDLDDYSGGVKLGHAYPTATVEGQTESWKSVSSPAQ